MLEDESCEVNFLEELRSKLVGKWFYDVRRKQNVLIFSVEDNKDTFVEKKRKLDHLCVLVAWAVGKLYSNSLYFC
jgi:hypothetical protein